MRQSSTLDLGWDVHNDSIAVADVAQEHGAEVIDLGAIGTRQGDIDHRIRTRPSKAPHLILIDEAGPCGSWLSRYFTKQGDDGCVVAPARVPQKAGDRGQTDRRDAMPLARLTRSGDLTVVEVPTVDDEALRDLTRAREDPLSPLQDATCRRNAFCRRHDIRDTGRAHGRPAHLRGLAAVVCPTPAHQIVFHEDVRAGNEHPERLQRLAHARHDHVKSWRLHPVVETLQAWRGVQCTVAVTMVAEVGDLSRFDPPSALMPCLGVIPSAYASGARRQQGSMTKAGNTHARRALVEGAWASRDPAQGSRPLPRRLETPPKVSQDISWKAQVRRCQRDRRLVATGTHANVVTVAMARAWVGLMWAMAQEVAVAPSGQTTDGP
jgi:transposase